jgi:hypothetical protein
MKPSKALIPVERIEGIIIRFPPDFLFQLTQEEKEEVVTICDHLSTLKFSPHLPFAFTEHGAIMAASVLNSERAIKVSVYVVRAFIRLREMAFERRELSRWIAELEKRIGMHDEKIKVVFKALQQLMLHPEKARSKI